MGEGIAGWVAEKNTSLIVNDVAERRPLLPRHRPEDRLPHHLHPRGAHAGEGQAASGSSRSSTSGAARSSREEDLQWLEIFSTQAAIAVQNARSFQKVTQRALRSCRTRCRTDEGWHTFIGESRIIRERLEIARKAAETDSSVLLLGESGVGKELFAEQIHLASPRGAQAVHPGELRRDPRGAAGERALRPRQGRLHRRRRGPARAGSSWPTAAPSSSTRSPTCRSPLQAKLLRVLQNRTFERVGASESIQVDVRIIAATNRNLERGGRGGQVPRGPLLPAERPAHPHPASAGAPGGHSPPRGVLPAEALAGDQEAGPGLHRRGHGAAALLRLAGQRAGAGERRGAGGGLRPRRIASGPSPSPSTQGRSADGDAYSQKTLREALNIFKKHFITKALEANGWHQTRTAKALAIQRSYLSKLVRELGIMKERGV